MGEQKRGYPHTGRSPKLRTEGQTETTVITIPKGVSEELDLQRGEEPEIEFDPDQREVRFQFE